MTPAAGARILAAKCPSRPERAPGGDGEESSIAIRRARRPVRVVAAALAAVLLAGPALAACDRADPWEVADCEPADRGGRSVARVWDEALLEMIRQVIPAPTVHARNLFHASVAMWDAWAAYDPVADGYLVTEKHEAGDRTRAREAAISFAAYRVLSWRYAVVGDLAAAPDLLDRTMRELCYRPDYTATEGDAPAALGNRIGRAVIDAGRDDGAGEEERYADHGYQPANDPLVVDQPGTVLRDPDRWQPLSLGRQVAQNGLPIPGAVQEYIGARWGGVVPFALPASTGAPPFDPGPPPRSTDPDGGAAYRREAVEAIRYGSLLDPADGVEVDIGPGALGGSTLGTNDGVGHPLDPATGSPYPPNRVLRGDYARVVAEYWADGPTSETPPGHWNKIANEVGDAPGFVPRIGGAGEPVDRLEWDVKLYLALNGALHDAAIAAWGLKRHYDSVRPISMIRHLAGRGQSSDPLQLSYDPSGLPLEPGLIEVVTPASSTPGERHAHLASYVGELVVRGWRGSPDDPANQHAGVGWVRALEWVPYQRPTFVTPAFPGFVSGHSTFSRAGAEVLTAMTGDPFFPGGMASWTVPRGELLHEEGPSRDVTLQWATYRDAADQAGISRLYGGIHVPADDLAGRRIGATCGTEAWRLATRYFDGSARP